MTPSYLFPPHYIPPTSLLTNGRSLKTVQGFVFGQEVRNWQHILTNQFADNYAAMVAGLAAFDVLNLGSVIGWGYEGHFPHPKAFVGTYSPISPAFNVAGKTGPQFLADLKAAKPAIQIYLYTTPTLDHTADAWDDATGVPAQNTTWSPQAGGARWANYINSIEAMRAGGDHLFDGVYLDLTGPGGISAAMFNEAILIPKRMGKSVMLNGVGASLPTVQFQLQCPHLGYGDWIYIEGFSFDSTNGSTTAASTNVATEIKKYASRGIRMAAVVEELGSTTYAQMTAGTPLTHITDGLALFDTHRQTGWAIEHQRSSYDYIGEPVA